jgi:hypothetical protein
MTYTKQEYLIRQQYHEQPVKQKKQCIKFLLRAHNQPISTLQFITCRSFRVQILTFHHAAIPNPGQGGSYL